MLALTVALVGPYFVDWTSYRADFEREAGRILGRNVTVKGAASAKLLPFPSITFTDVVVDGINPGEPAMTVETFSMDAELAPFMQGNIHIFDMRLVRPSVLIDVADDGAIDWAVRPSVPLGADHVSLEKLTVTEGKATIRHASSGRTHTLTEVNAEMSARSLAGPWRMDGSLRLDGMRTALSVTTGAVEANGMRLRVRAQPERYPFTLEADGSARVENGRANYAGTFRLNASAPGQQQPQPKNAPPAYRMSGGFDFDPAALKVGEFRFETGPVEDPYVAEGSADFDLGETPSFVIRADGAQVRFDDAIASAAEAVSLDVRLAAIRDFLLDMPRPAIPGRVELSLPAIVAGDTTVRDVHLKAVPQDGGWNIDSVGATLPGRATLEASGVLSVGEQLGFSGEMLLAVAQPSGFATWVARDVDDAIRRLPGAGFSAKVELSQEQQLFHDLELVLGTSKFTGTIESRTPTNQRPSMKMTLDGGALDIEGMSAFASLFVSDSGQSRHVERDIELAIVAGPVTAVGLTAETLDTSLRLKDGTLEIDKLSLGELAGANVSATGSVRNFGGMPAGTIDATIIAPDLGPLVDALATRFSGSNLLGALSERGQVYPGLYDDATVRVVATSAMGGEALGLALSASGETGGTSFSLAGSASNVMVGLANSSMKIELSARNEEAASLYALSGLPALPLGLAGSGQLDLTFEGSVSTGGKTVASFTGLGLSATFDGDAALVGDVISANGAAKLQSSDLEPWLAAAGVSLPGFGYGLPVTLAAELDAQEGILVLSSLNGNVADVPLSGDLNAQMRDGLPHLTGSLQIADFDLGFVADMVVGADAMASFAGEWSTTPFASKVTAPFSAEMELGVDQLFAGTDWQADDARLTLKLGREGASVSGLTASAYGGKLSGLVDFRNDGGTGLLSAQLRLVDGDATAVLGDKGLSGNLGLTSSFTASGKSVEGIIASLSGSGSAHIKDASIGGIAPGVFADLLAAADEVGPEINAEATDRLASQRVREGAFAVTDADMAFTIANGILRAPPVLMRTEGASLNVELQADLAARTLSANSLLTYDAGKEALVGSEPSVRFLADGPVDAIDVSVDTEPLAQFLTQRALEKEQQRVELMQSALLERQRLRREVRYYSALAEDRRKADEAEQNDAGEVERLERLQRQLDEEAERRGAEQRTQAPLQGDKDAASQQAEAQQAPTPTAPEVAQPVVQSEPTPAPQSEDDLALPDTVTTLPQPAPRGSTTAPMPARAQSPDGFSIDGIIRALEETR